MKWISVEEELPEDNQRVLTCWLGSYHPIQLQTFYGEGTRGPDAWWLGGTQNHLVDDGCITHWMPLPEVPTH